VAKDEQVAAQQKDSSGMCKPRGERSPGARQPEHPWLQTWGLWFQSLHAVCFVQVSKILRR
jgi:hypothetical protein